MTWIKPNLNITPEKVEKRANEIKRGKLSKDVKIGFTVLNLKQFFFKKILSCMTEDIKVLSILKPNLEEDRLEELLKVIFSVPSFFAYI